MLQPLAPIPASSQLEQCFVPAVLERVADDMTSACENVGVRVRMDPLIATLAHEGGQAQNSSSSSPNGLMDNVSSCSSRDLDAYVAAGMSGRAATASKVDAGFGQSRTATGRGSRYSAQVQRQGTQGQPVLLPPPSRGLLLRGPVLPDRRQFYVQVPPEVGIRILCCYTAIHSLCSFADTVQGTICSL